MHISTIDLYFSVNMFLVPLTHHTDYMVSKWQNMIFRGGVGEVEKQLSLTSCKMLQHATFKMG